MDFQNVKPGSTPPVCFSCGRELPKKDFKKFHKNVKKLQSEGKDENEAQKITLDNIGNPLSQIYYSVCCRVMFLGDPYEHRQFKKLYNYDAKSQHVSYEDNI